MGDDAPTRALPPFRKVAGTCPACAGSTLMLGAGDHVTCSLIGCPDPMAASRRLEPRPPVSDDKIPQPDEVHVWNQADAHRLAELKQAGVVVNARAVAVAALDAAYSLAPIANPNAVQVNGGRVLVTYEQAVDALADAGLLAGPSHLDRLAAWADEHDERVRIDRWPAALSKWAVATPLHAVNELDEDAQEAARRVLARREATDA